MRNQIAGCVAALLLLGGCGPDAVDTPPGPKPEATSLFGEALYPTPVSDEARARMEGQLAEAMEVHLADPGEPRGIVWVGRRQAYLGRYRDAIATFTTGLEEHPDESHLLRHRGHRWITVREFGQAIADLSRAAELTLDAPDEVEPDGAPNAAGIPTSTLQTNIWYHLGLAHYLLGRFDAAETAFHACYDLATNDDMRIAAADWVYMSLRRQERHTEAEAFVEWVTPDLELLENYAYHRRILLYRGILPVDSLLSLPDAEDAALNRATQGYGVGNWYLANGDTARAIELYRSVLDTGFWPAFGYIAAEADLERLGVAPRAGE